MEQIGVVTHFFSNIGVAAIKLSGELKVGDKVKIQGATTDFETVINSMQIDRNPVDVAKAGDEIGIKVPDKTRKKDSVFKI